MAMQNILKQNFLSKYMINETKKKQCIILNLKMKKN
jgi:hypothetical protein